MRSPFNKDGELRERRVVTLCGSTKFAEAYAFMNAWFTARGYIVLSCGWFGHAGIPSNQGFIPTDDNLDTLKVRLDQLHFDKILLSDEIFVIDVDKYVGDSTANEIKLAKSVGVPVILLSETPEPTLQFLKKTPESK